MRSNGGQSRMCGSGWAFGADTWLAQQRKRIVDHERREQTIREAPPEVRQRRVNGETVIQR